MSEPLNDLVNRAFRDTVEAGEIIYAAGLPREIKDEYLAAHSHLLRLKTMLASRDTARRTARLEQKEAKHAARHTDLG